MGKRLIHAGYPCDTCGNTDETNESAHLSCDYCSWIGCSDECAEDHLWMEHEHELELSPEEMQIIESDDYEQND